MIVWFHSLPEWSRTLVVMQAGFDVILFLGVWALASQMDRVERRK